mmetsp:Transcript_66963/g.159768  ORF Transcript_66963/g.159768 Transcript_66963/m.159768 type:complete len:224 (-) Transcript_66963:895-1566(-)
MYMPHIANTASICRPIASRHVPSQLCGFRCFTSARTLSNASDTWARKTSTKFAELLIRMTPPCVRSITLELDLSSPAASPAAVSCSGFLLTSELSPEPASAVRRSSRSTVPSPPLTTASDVQPTSERCAPSDSALLCEQSCAALKITSAARYVAGWSRENSRAFTLSSTSSIVICSSCRFFASGSAAQKSEKPLWRTEFPQSLSSRCSSSFRNGSKYDCNTRS